MSKISIKSESSNSGSRAPSVTLKTDTKRRSKSQSVERIESAGEKHIPLNKEEQRIKDSKARYEEDVKKHQIVDVKPAKLEVDWQVSYVWSFIMKFNLRNQISKLECIQDFERCLTEPMANRPDDILESILICFLNNIKNLRSGSKTITPENIQHQLSTYITDQLTNTSEWTVWDRGWPINEEDRGSCCTSDPHSSELGRLRYYGEPSNARASKNPIKRMEAKGGGIFELDWSERTSLLRQMVDWQLTHSETIRDKIHKEFPAKANESRAKKPTPAETIEKDTIAVKELGLTRERARVWSFDDSWRLYQSGNPYKRPCQLTPITTDRESYDKFVGDLEEFSNQVDNSSNPVSKGSKQALEIKKLIQAKKNEGLLAEKLKERIETVEKEEARIQRARRRIAQAIEMQQRAELRSTRTRRQSRKIDYVYDDHSEIDSDSGPSSRKRRRLSPEFSGLDDKGKPIIPGERRSARQAGRPYLVLPGDPEDFDQKSNGNNDEEISIEMSRNASSVKSENDYPRSEKDEEMGSANGEMNHNGNSNGKDNESSNGVGEKKKKNRMKGYAWVEE